MIDISDPPMLGDAQLDHDHAELFRLCRALLDVPSDAIRPAVEQLRAEMRAHFASEDADLRRLGGNNVDCHLDEHAAVLASLDEVHLILGESQTVAHRLISSLALELLRWLPEHVSEMDANLAAVRSQSRFGGVGVRITPRPAPLA
ncbi:bacteriohemerythrin [Pantoea sp. 18069]|uniref:bacteriohemerythrin n=1 Tax=Pantoea sp. 18069 TaxID=2681415 RepID=UPI001356AE9C|nr:hemerythrin family protein [Pantoea sp. 18069]